MHKQERSEITRWREILAVVVTGALKFVLMDALHLRALYIVSACLFWLIFIYRKYKHNPQILHQWGFRRKNLKKTMLLLLPFAAVAIAGMLVYGTRVEANFLNWHFLPILLFYPVWGLFQQFIMAALLAGNLQSLRSLKLSKAKVLFITALLFALVHLPSIPLMIYVLIMQILFLWVYFRWRNLWPLGLYHGWVSSFFLYFVMERDLLAEFWFLF